MARPNHQWDISAVKHMKIEEEPAISALSLPVIVDPSQAERYIEKLVKFDLSQVGSHEWMEQHRKLEKLNMQAHQNAMSNSDEFVLEAVLTFNKTEVLIHDLLLIEAWKENIYPLLIDDLVGKNSMRLYFILYHEATIINLFEVFFYYKHFVEACGDKLIDIADYLARKLSRLQNPNFNFRECDINKSLLQPTDPEAAKQFAEEIAKQTPKEDLLKQWTEIEFRICVASVAMARYLCEHAEVLQLSVVSRISDTHDFLLLFIPLIENPPWTRRLQNGKWQKLIDQRWTPVLPIDLLKITKLEGQPWIGLYTFLAKETFRERYHLNSFRKGQLLRVRKYINEILLDQLPFLADVQRYMDELAVTNVPEPSSLSGNGSVFMFQQVAVLTEAIVKGKDFPSIAIYQKKEVFTMTDRNDKDLLAMADLYSDDAVEGVMDNNLASLGLDDDVRVQELN